MKKENAIPLSIVQNCAFEILKYIRDVCEKNGLMYYLAYGTLIGAVRHQDFIPWDDDVDIHMPREDYLKLVDIVEKEPHPYYRLISKETTPTYTREIAKMIDSRTKLKEENNQVSNGKAKLGIFVDIFLLDGAGNTQEEAEETYREAYAIFRDWMRAIKKMFFPDRNMLYTIPLWIKHVPKKIKGVHYWMKKHDEFCIQKAYDECTYVGAMGAGTQDPRRNVWQKKWFGDGTDVIFHGEVFRAPVNWDAVLRPEYGNYMELPPLEERYPHHQRSLEIPDYVVITETIKGKEENSEDKRLEHNKEKKIMSSGVISIIIPVYNTERFLNRCVESVLQQSYRNIEVLLIDDGSTDNSGKLCDEWEKKDARIRTIHKENGGLSDARNAGLDAASGEFIAFVDSDDYIAPDMIQKLYDAIKKNNAEMSICRFLFVDEKGTPIRGKNKRIPEIEGTFSTHDVLKQAAEIGWYYTVAWNKLYKRSLFSEIRFPKGRLHEDLFVSHLLLELCGTVVCISEVGYYYVQHDGSILKNKSKKLYMDAAKAYLERSSFFCRHGLQKGAGKAYLLSALCLTDACLIKSDKPEIQEEWEALFKSFQKNYRFKNYCTKKEKLQISIICSNPELYYLLFRNSYERKAKAIIDLCAERISTR